MVETGHDIEAIPNSAGWFTHYCRVCGAMGNVPPTLPCPGSSSVEAEHRCPYRLMYEWEVEATDRQVRVILLLLAYSLAMSTLLTLALLGIIG